jgi:hypothetical protein
MIQVLQVLSELRARNPQIFDRINPPSKTAGRQDQQDSYVKSNIKTETSK